MAVVNLRVGGRRVSCGTQREARRTEELFARPEEDRSGNDEGPWRLPRAFAINGRNERIRRRSSIIM